jgi:hypothetical protein
MAGEHALINLEGRDSSRARVAWIRMPAGVSVRS